MKRRGFLAFAAAGLALRSVTAAGDQAGTEGGGNGRVEEGIREFLKLPGKQSFVIEVSPPGTPWQRAHRPDAQMFVGSAVKTFILTTFLRFVETGALAETDQLPIDNEIRSPDSAIFGSFAADSENLTGTASARTVLEAMISHSDNTATDAALAHVGVDNVRQFIISAGLTSTLIADSTRLLLSYLAGAPLGVDVGWKGALEIINGHLFGPPRSPLNNQETMQSTASEFVSYYQRALDGKFFSKQSTLTEFQRIQTMADAIARVVPSDIKAYAKGGSIGWQNFHAVCVPGQMIVKNVPVTFCFTLNWNGPDGDVPAVLTAYQASVAKILAGIASTAG
jgi:beta-lactamase class A